MLFILWARTNTENGSIGFMRCRSWSFGNKHVEAGMIIVYIGAVILPILYSLARPSGCLYARCHPVLICTETESCTNAVTVMHCSHDHPTALNPDSLLIALKRLPTHVLNLILSYTDNVKLTASFESEKAFNNALYRCAITSSQFPINMWIGVYRTHEAFCMWEAASEILAQLRRRRLGKYLLRKMLLFGDYGVLLMLLTRACPISAFTALIDNPQIPLAHRELLAPHLYAHLAHHPHLLKMFLLFLGFRPEFNLSHVDYSAVERAGNFHLPAWFLGAMLTSTQYQYLFIITPGATAHREQMLLAFQCVPSNQHTDSERQEIYRRNEYLFDRYLIPTDKACFHVVNVIKFGTLPDISGLDLNYRSVLLGKHRFSLFGAILNSNWNRPDHIKGWAELYEKNGLPAAEYDAVFGDGQLGTDADADGPMSAAVRHNLMSLHHHVKYSRSERLISVWYRAMDADLSAPDPMHGLSLETYLTAFRLAEVRKDKVAMMGFAARAFETPQWASGPSIWTIPRHPVFMRQLLCQHAKWKRYVKYYFAYAVVHRIRDLIECVLERYRGSPHEFKALCEEMLAEGYLPAAYVGDFFGCITSMNHIC